jgi:hypothetical protein
LIGLVNPKATSTQSTSSDAVGSSEGVRREAPERRRYFHARDDFQRYDVKAASTSASGFSSFYDRVFRPAGRQQEFRRAAVHGLIADPVAYLD